MIKLISNHKIEKKYQYGIYLLNKSDYANAKIVFNDLYNENKHNYDYLNMLAIVEFKMGNIDRSLEIYENAFEQDKTNLNIILNYANVLQDKTEYEKAEKLYNLAIEINPEFTEAYYNKGNVFLKNKKYLKSIENYDLAIRLNKNYESAYLNRGVAFGKIKEFEESIKNFNKAINLNSKNVEAYSNKAESLRELNQYVQALENCNMAIELNKEYAPVYYNKAIIYHKLSEYSNAIINYEKAIEHNSNFFEAYSAMGNAYKLKFNYIESLNTLLLSLKIYNQYASTWQLLSGLLAYMSEHTKVIEYSNKALDLADDENIKEIWESRLYNLIYHPDKTSKEIVDEHIRWGGTLQCVTSKFNFHERQKKISKKLKIGYVSPDFRDHTCRYYFEPLFANHNLHYVELYAYSNVSVEDEHTERFKKYFYKWNNIVNLSDELVSELIYQDEIDILVDGCGHMMDTRLNVFKYKPAPIQVTWLGSAWTTGLPTIDYVLFDPYMAPEGTLASENILRLPRTWTAFRPGKRAISVDVKESPLILNNYITFGYSGRSERLNYKVFNVWGQILSKIPNAKLILDYKSFEDKGNQSYYIKLMQVYGVDTNRIIFRNSINIFESLNDIDILLDSFPHSGGTMLFDAIWMGVPVITLASDRPVGRIGTSLMTNLGLPEWVAKDEQEYVSKAVAFAHDVPALTNLRRSMRARMQGSPVMDEKGFAEDVEAAFKNMWSNWINSANNDSSMLGITK